MYSKPDHAELHIPSLRQYVHDNPLGLLITSIKSPNLPTIQCTHIPWILHVSDPQSETDLGTLQGHLARANPHSKAMSEAVQASNSTANGFLDEEVCITFTSPVHHYVTPKFYTDTKPSTGKVVPTWNYSTVQAYGRARIFSDAKASETGEYLQMQISDLTRHAEAKVMGYTPTNGLKPWAVTDAPGRYIEIMKKSIIGIEVEITRLEGKFKMSQDKGKGDRTGVIQGYDALNSEIGREMAKLVQDRAELKKSRLPKPS